MASPRKSTAKKSTAKKAPPTEPDPKAVAPPEPDPVTKPKKDVIDKILALEADVDAALLETERTGTEKAALANFSGTISQLKDSIKTDAALTRPAADEAKHAYQPPGDGPYRTVA